MKAEKFLFNIWMIEHEGKRYVAENLIKGRNASWRIWEYIEKAVSPLGFKGKEIIPDGRLRNIEAVKTYVRRHHSLTIQQLKDHQKLIEQGF